MTIAKAKASIGNIQVGIKTVKIVLEISKKDFFRNSKFFESDPEDVQMVLGDPQMSLDDYDDDDELERRRLWHTTSHHGLTATVDGSGVVEKVEASEEEEGQGDLFEEPADPSIQEQDSGIVDGEESFEEELDFEDPDTSISDEQEGERTEEPIVDEPSPEG